MTAKIKTKIVPVRKMKATLRMTHNVHPKPDAKVAKPPKAAVLNF